ncbi:MAG: PIN domain-containing protein [Cyanobacteria bacterium J06597_16]
MLRQVIADTGVIVALLDQREPMHTQVVQKLVDIAPPMLTCEAVISEAWFLLQRASRGQEGLLLLLRRGQLEVRFDLSIELLPVLDLLERYQSVPASLADAELVRMAELYPSSSVFTLDSDFQIYRKNRDVPIPLIAP